MTVTAFKSSHAQPDLFFLRGLLWCEPCGELLIPACNSEGQRFYGCTNQQCRARFSTRN
jgi:hypothetical protein